MTPISISPILHPGEYVFCSMVDPRNIPKSSFLMSFEEPEGTTLLLKKEVADQYHLTYSFVASWIMIAEHTTLDAVGITATISTALAREGIGCNVIAAFYHDHIFVQSEDAIKAMAILTTC